MRYYPDVESEHEVKEAETLKAEPWMMELLRLNPDYCSWGPYEDAMGDKREGWRAPLFFNSWREFLHPGQDEDEEGGFHLDDLNECVNFYFEVGRESKDCQTCGQEGYNPETRKILDDFYDFDETGRRWCDNITQDEVDALVEAGRLRHWDAEKKCWVQVTRTADEVNAANKRGHKTRSHQDMLSHDGINRHILIEARAKRLGVYGLCPKCEGRGYVYTEPKAHVNLVLWILHPRKGASRGVEIKNIRQEDLPKVFAWLREAAKRNANRFTKIPMPEAA